MRDQTNSTDVLTRANINSSVPVHMRNPATRERNTVLPHEKILAHVAQWLRPDVYVEYGMAACGSMLSVAPYCKRAIGVDIKSHPYMQGIPNLDFYNMSTDMFKERFLDKCADDFTIDMAFIDADHEAEQVVRDFDALYAKLVPNGFIFIHDTYPISEMFTEQGYCGDSYKVPFIIKKKYPGIDIMTIPVQPGMTVIRKPWALSFQT